MHHRHRPNPPTACSAAATVEHREDAPGRAHRATKRGARLALATQEEVAEVIFTATTAQRLWSRGGRQPLWSGVDDWRDVRADRARAHGAARRARPRADARRGCAVRRQGRL